MTSKTTNKFAPEVRERAVRMVFGHERDYPSQMGDRYRLPRRSAAFRRRYMSG
jgi:hypothetical protein